MHNDPNETTFRCCYGLMAKDHGAFNYLYRYALPDVLLCMENMSEKSIYLERYRTGSHRDLISTLNNLSRTGGL